MLIKNQRFSIMRDYILHIDRNPEKKFSEISVAFQKRHLLCESFSRKATHFVYNAFKFSCSKTASLISLAM